MKYMIYSSKYEVFLKILLLYLVECSLDFTFFFLEIRDIPFGFLVGEGLFFPNSFKLDFVLKQSESIYFL